MSGVIFMVYIPTPDEEERLRCREWRLRFGYAGVSRTVIGSKANLGFREVFAGQDRPEPRTHPCCSPGRSSPIVVRERSLKRTLGNLLEHYSIEAVTWFENDFDLIQVVFPVQSNRCEEVLNSLLDAGIGEVYRSQLSVLPCSLHYEGINENLNDNSDFMGTRHKVRTRRPDEGADDFLSSVRARLTVAEVVEGVRTNAALTFDFFAFLVLGSMLATLGLVNDNPVDVVASMLLSPLMAPILACTFGASMKERSLIQKGFLTGLCGIGICLLFGFFFGAVCGPASVRWGKGPWPTTRMSAMGHWRSLWTGALTAIPAGGGVALAVLGGNLNCLVGVAISSLLLPSAVNAGLLWGYSLLLFLESLRNIEETLPPTYETIYYDDMVMEFSMLGLVSLALTWINAVCIWLVGTLVLKVKGVVPTNDYLKRIWNHDLKVLKKCHKDSFCEGRLYERLFKEWTKVNDDFSETGGKEQRFCQEYIRYQEGPTLSTTASCSCCQSPEKGMFDCALNSPVSGGRLDNYDDHQKSPFCQFQLLNRAKKGGCLLPIDIPHPFSESSCHYIKEIDSSQEYFLYG